MAGKAEVYKDPKVQAFLSKLMSEDLGAIYPAFDLEHGFRYPDVEEIVGDPPSVKAFLGNLFEAGILKRQLYDKVIFCPNCGSANVSIHYRCPHCKSLDIKKSSLIEHLRCGYIDVEERFRAGEKLVCPRCHGELTKVDVDYVRAGVWCTCNGCGKSFDIPIPHHFCRECRQSFTFEEAIYKDACSYSLNKDVIKEAALGWTLTATLREFLQDRDFRVESPGFIEGKSGVRHMFNIVAHGKGTTRHIIVINLAISTTDEPVSKQSIVQMFAKVYDSASDQAFLIAIPKIDETGKRLASLYKIGLIEATDRNEALAALKALIR